MLRRWLRFPILLGVALVGVALAGADHAASAAPTTGGPATTPDGRPALPLRYYGTGATPHCKTTGELHRGGSAYRVVVHYTRKGRDKVPLRDRDRTGVPDYVECTASAASRALEVYRRLGFRRPKPDQGGGNYLPDVYLLGRDPDDAFGVVERDRRGDVYMVVSTLLSAAPPGIIAGPRGTIIEPNPRIVRQSLWFTAAHEAFHIVQSAYLRRAEAPEWIWEGSANSLMLTALYDRAFPKDFREDTDAWLAESFHSITYASPNCDHCYGQGIFWFWLNAGEPESMVRLIFERLAAQRARGERIGTGVTAVSQVLEARGRSFADLLGRTTLFYAGLIGAEPSPGWPIFEQTDDFPPASSTPHSFSWTANAYSAAHIRIPVTPGQPAAAVPLAVRVASPDLVPIVWVGGGETRIAPAGVDETTGVWNYDIPTAALSDGCTLCRPGLIDLIMQNTTGNKVQYALTYGLRSPP